jgi:hypothetical protein
VDERPQAPPLPARGHAPPRSRPRPHQAHLDAPYAMLPAEFLAVFQPGDGRSGVAGSRAAEANGVGGRHGQQLLIHPLRPSPVRGPCQRQKCTVKTITPEGSRGRPDSDHLPALSSLECKVAFPGPPALPGHSPMPTPVKARPRSLPQEAAPARRFRVLRPGLGSSPRVALWDRPRTQRAAQLGDQPGQALGTIPKKWNSQL